MCPTAGESTVLEDDSGPTTATNCLFGHTTHYFFTSQPRSQQQNIPDSVYPSSDSALVSNYIARGLTYREEKCNQLLLLKGDLLTAEHTLGTEASYTADLNPDSAYDNNGVPMTTSIPITTSLVNASSGFLSVTLSDGGNNVQGSFTVPVVPTSETFTYLSPAT